LSVQALLLIKIEYKYGTILVRPVWHCIYVLRNKPIIDTDSNVFSFQLSERVKSTKLGSGSPASSPTTAQEEPIGSLKICTQLWLSQVPAAVFRASSFSHQKFMGQQLGTRRLCVDRAF
jgi:hypothetical protein